MAGEPTRLSEINASTVGELTAGACAVGEAMVRSMQTAAVEIRRMVSLSSDAFFFRLKAEATGVPNCATGVHPKSCRVASAFRRKKPSLT